MVEAQTCITVLLKKDQKFLLKVYLQKNFRSRKKYYKYYKW